MSNPTREEREQPNPSPIPHSPRGPTTFAYERALLNRIPYPRLVQGAVYDIHAYKPTFIHDSLMLPGSLANLVGKSSTEDILNRCTPAILPNFHTHIDAQTLQPYLIPAAPAAQHQTSHVTGILLLGQGKETRKRIHAHYRNLHMRRKRVDVEIEVLVPSFVVVEGDGGNVKKVWNAERLAVNAHVWVADARDVEGCRASRGAVAGYRDEDDCCPEWKLEEYLEGMYGVQRPMRISEDGKGDEGEHGFVERDVAEEDSEDRDGSMVEFESARELEG